MSLSLGFANGKNKEAEWAPQIGENILPPFDSGEWRIVDGVPTNIEAHGYEIQFEAATNVIANYTYVIPNPQRFAGMSMTLSIGELIGPSSTRAEVNFLGVGTWSNVQNSGGHITFVVPNNITWEVRVHMSIRANQVGIPHFFRNPILTIGGPVRFQPKQPSPPITNHGLSVIGTNGRVISARAPLAGITSSHLEFECEFTTGAVLPNFNSNIMRINNSIGLQLATGGQLRFLNATAMNSDWNIPITARLDTELDVIQVNTRYYVRVIFNNARREIWIDNRLVASHNGAVSNLIASANQMQLFANGVNFDNVFDGVIHKAILRRNHHPIISYDFTNQDVNSSTVTDTASGNHGIIQGNISYVQQSPIFVNHNISPITEGEIGRGIEGLSHSIQISGLKPSTRYFIGFRLASSTLTSSTNLGVISNGRISGSARTFSNVDGANTLAGATGTFFLHFTTPADTLITETTNISLHSNVIGGRAVIRDIRLIEMPTGNEVLPFVPYVKNQPRSTQMLNAANLEYPYDFTRNSNGQWQGLNFGDNQPRVNRSIGGADDES